MGDHNPFVSSDGWSFDEIGTYKPNVLQTHFAGLVVRLRDAGG